LQNKQILKKQPAKDLFANHDENKTMKDLKPLHTINPSYLYDIFSAPLYGFIKQMIGEDHFAEKILQICFLRIWDDIQSCSSPEDGLFARMTNTVRNAVMEYRAAEELQCSNKYIHENIAPATPVERVIRELSMVRKYSPEQISTLLQLPLHTIQKKITAIRHLDNLSSVTNT
jgi:DNA-directed RNA polymerase specialized sigma24 family protein